jgi:hypothetical protein
MFSLTMVGDLEGRAATGVARMWHRLTLRRGRRVVGAIGLMANRRACAVLAGAVPAQAEYKTVVNKHGYAVGFETSTRRYVTIRDTAERQPFRGRAGPAVPGRSPARSSRCDPTRAGRACMALLLEAGRGSVELWSHGGRPRCSASSVVSGRLVPSRRP